MEGGCAVETWADFGFSGTSRAPKLRLGAGTDVFLCPGGDEVYVFSTKENKLTVVLQFPGPVSDLVESRDKQHLYVACRNGVYRVSLQFMLSSTGSSPADASSSPTELKISSEDLAVPEEVLSLLLVGSALVTLSQRDASWTLTLYNPSKQLGSSGYEMLTSFSLPLISDVMDNNTEAKTRTPVLICVHCSDTPASSCSASSSETTLPHGHFRLQSALFKLLFGVDAALAKSPVILYGLPDGRLCFLPLCLPESRLRVLHSLEQPVIFVGACSVVETGPGHAECLLAVGELGRVLLIRTDKGGSEGGGSTAGFIERCVPGPVVCGCVDKNCLYYSTGSDLLRLDLSEGSSGREGRERDEASSRKTDAALQSPTSLNVCRVSAVAGPASNSAGDLQLLGLSLRGQLQRITLPVEREDANLPKVPSAQVGGTIGDFLSAIGDVCDRASALKTAIKSKNQTLMRLNQALSISFLLLAGTNDEEQRRVQERPISCRGTTQWSRLLHKDSLSLTCVLDNSSPYVFERGWTLSVTVFPLSCSPDAGGDGSSTNFLFPVHSLRPGETLEASLPLETSHASFPVTARCSLVLSLSSLLEEEAAALPGLQSGCVSLPLNTLTVDWLHALQVTRPSDAHQRDAAHRDATADSVQAFLSSRHIGCTGRGEGGREGAPKLEPERRSASVRVALELLRHTAMSKSSGLDRRGPTLAPENVCSFLLEWLLSEGFGGVRTGHPGDGRSEIHARGPDSHAVKLTAKEVDAAEESSGKESLTAVEVQVESSSMAAVCGLHHAVLRRLQALVQRAPEGAASTKSVQSLGLRLALQRAEHLLQQIQQSRVSEAFGLGTSSGQMSRALLAVYRQLRENPVIIT